MFKDDKQILVSNQELLNISYTFDQIRTMTGELAMDVAGISLSENDKELPIDYMPRNKYSNMLFLLSDYAGLLSQKITSMVSDAGGDI